MMPGSRPAAAAGRHTREAMPENTPPRPATPDDAAATAPSDLAATPGPAAGGATATVAQDAPIPREIWVLVAAALVIALGYGLVAPVLPRFATSFGVGVAAASFIVSIFAIFRLVFAPVGGGAVARVGERPVYIAGVLIVAASTLATAFAHSYWQLLLFRGLGGIGSTMFTVAAMGLVVRLAPPSRRGAASSAYASAFLIGNMTGPFLGGLLAGYGMRVPFIVYGVALVVAALLVTVALPASALRPKPGSVPLPAMTFREGLADPAYRSVLVSSFANGWANFGIRMSLVPLFAAGALHAGDVETGVALTVFAVGNAVGIALVGRLVDVTGRRRPLLLGLVVGAVAVLAMGWSGSVLVLSVLSALAGVGAGMVGPAQQAAVGDIVGSERSGGQVLAAFQMASDLGAIVGPIVAGVVVDRAGYGPAFALSAVVLSVAVAVWLPQPETLPGAEHAAAR